jgi:hypothetical protein
MDADPSSLLWEASSDACFRLDRKTALEQLEQHPEYLRETKPIFEAARRDRADVVALMLDLGVPIEIEGGLFRSLSCLRVSGPTRRCEVRKE